MEAAISVDLPSQGAFGQMEKPLHYRVKALSKQRKSQKTKSHSLLWDLIRKIIRRQTFHVKFKVHSKKKNVMILLL